MTDVEKKAHEFAVMYAQFALSNTKDIYASKPGETAIDYALTAYIAAKDRFMHSNAV